MSAQITPAIKPGATPNPGMSRGADSPNGQVQVDTQVDYAVEGNTSPATMDASAPSRRLSRGSETADRQVLRDTHRQPAVGADSAVTKARLTPTEAASLPSDPGPQANVSSASILPALADPVLALAADVLDDLEKVRIANENRLRQLTRSTEDSDGEERGFGLDQSHPDVARLAALVDMLAKAEHQAELNLKRQLRQHSLGPWVKAARGVGEKQAARLLAAVGDPFWNFLHDRPRTVSELWAYAGYHVVPARHGSSEDQTRIAGGAQLGSNPDQTKNEPQGADVGVAAARARGQKANWSATAKMRARLVAVSIVKAGGPYREVYDKARAKYDDAVHQVECKRCGPSGRPAQPGSPLSAGHQHARALRIVAKEVLKDLWREAKRIHETTEVAPATRATSTSIPGASSGFINQDSGHGAADAQANSAAVRKPGDGHYKGDAQALPAVADHTEEDRSPRPHREEDRGLTDNEESTR